MQRIRPEVRIFHASDVHFGAEDRVALDWFAAAVAAERPDAIAITGDLTMRARRREFAAACDWILSLGAPDPVPVTVEVGNHDLPYFNPIERFFTPYKRIHAIERLVEREIDLAGVSLIPLTTTARAQARLNWSRGIVTDHALRTTLAALATVPRDRMTLVTAHHPLVEAGTRGKALTTGGNRALAALAKAGVHAVLTGHVHDPFDLVRATPHGPIRMIGAGTLSSRLRSTPPSFNELTLVDGVLTVRVRTWLGVSTPDMQIDEIPADASQPLPGDAIAPVAVQE